MALYEHLLIARQDISAQQVDALATHLKTIVEGEGGKVEKQEYWGLRGLAYRIKKNRKGHYVLLNINAPSKAVVELERQLKINEDVLRYITVKVDQFEVSSNKNRRDDRPKAKPEGEARRGGRTMSYGGNRDGGVAAIVTADATAKADAAAATRRRPAPSLLPPQEDLPVLRRQRAQDRLQGREAAAALHLRARQDRAVAHHRRVATRSSASWPTPSSARASWRCCPTS